MNQTTLSFTNSQFLLTLRHLMQKKPLLALLGISLFTILIISFLLLPTDVTAQKLHNSGKEIVSVQINKGDTLWSIAGRYITEEYKDMNDYIKEIKKTNGLTSDTIHEGGYIVVPYYAKGE